MAADRDLGVAFVRAWSGPPAHRLAGWEATAATGVRGLRLVEETGAFASFLFTESNPAAFEVLERNLAGRPGTRAALGDGRTPPDGAPFDYVDVDPFGSPIPFVRAAVGSVRRGGVLAVTATDMVVLAGAQPEATWRRYGARPVKGRLGPESGLRILLAYIARAARDTGGAIRPLLCYARDHHVRAYVERRATPEAPDPVGPVDPATWDGPFLGPTGPFGPLWLGPLIDPEVAGRLEVPPGAERPRETAQFVERLREEAAVPSPFYYEPNVLAGRLRLPHPPSIAGISGALTSRGFRVARTHARPEGIRTDAPREVVESVARALCAPAQSQNARVRA